MGMFKFTIVYLIFFININIIIAKETEECKIIFKNHMIKINEENMTLRELKKHIMLADYYSYIVFSKNNNKIINYELKYLSNICNINYDKLDFNKIKNKIIISRDSKDKLNNIIQLKNTIYNLFKKIFKISLFIIFTKLFLSYPMLPIIYFIWYYFNYYF